MKTIISTSLILSFVTGTSAWALAQNLVSREAPGEINAVPGPQEERWIALSGATLIDGTGNPPIEDSVVLIRGNRIIAAGTRTGTPIPAQAEVQDVTGLFLLPGLIDAHFHLSNQDLPSLFLQNGVTSIRDPGGAWFDTYDPVLNLDRSIPRIFLSGPHLDMPPPAYPSDAVLVRDPMETERTVNRWIDLGASAIKVYFRLSLDLIRVACETAHTRGVPVTAHLEIVPADQAIDAGLDGIEHITSVGNALIPDRASEAYRREMLADNGYRRTGRYRMWESIDLKHPRVSRLLDLIVNRGVILSPTLAIFERQANDPEVEEFQVKGFQKMMEFTGMAARAGARVVVGSHSSVPYAEQGEAYFREMELLAESGLTPMQVIQGATALNATFFRMSDRLGTVDSGKIADLILIDGDPLEDIRNMRRVQRVMLNGRWVTEGD